MAIVAVGSVFATAKRTGTTLQGSPYNDQGACATPSNLTGTCDVNYTTNACQLWSGGDAFIQNEETGFCTVALYRQN
ncbi:hypothetical protein HDC92_003804 [Pedobacter sp. AK017]|uniref:hypothetical protein n=1 Tax=Pedobacter sp. AK017 TaxID=2723073 RepID=UPI0017B257BB|nr:hypothetical protein [Pedobacter sp. AK017]MBB5440106.1 hypothetical protein [Pedobacter sp. AK017]